MSSFIIFSGFNNRAVISFLRTLYELKKKTKNLEFGVITLPYNDPILFTKYKKNVVSKREKIELNKEDIFKSIKQAKNKLKSDSCIIVPLTEALNRFLLENREDLKELGCEIPLVEKNLYELISDKIKFYELCKDNNLLVPEEVEPSDKSLPFVAKPKYYYSKSGGVYSPILLFTKTELKEFLRNYKIEDFFYQRFITGISYYLLYYFTKKGEVIKLSQKNLIQQSGGKSIIAAIPSTFHYDKISLRIESLFLEIGFYGLVMVEIRREKDKDHLIEANPRFWGPSQLFVDAKPNLFEYFLSDLGITKIVSSSKTNYNVRYFWNGGIVKSKKTIVFHEYRPIDFIEEYKKWLKYDILLRKDTKELYFREILDE